MDISTISTALAHPNVRAFLRVIRAGESNQDDSAYTTLVGGGRFEDTRAHPNQLIDLPSLGVKSTAAGAYQFLYRTWEECRKALDLQDFGPGSQDLAAVYLIQRRSALQDLLDGHFETAVAKCAKEWASLPGSPYGQPTLTIDRARAVYLQYSGTLGPAPSPAPSDPYAQEGNMPIPLAPIISAVLPTIVQQIPKLGKLFGSGSQVAERNLQAAQVVVEAVTAATGAINAQEAAEKISSDPVARQAAQEAVNERWFEITEAGGGGIDGARKADAAARASGDILHSPSFWFTLAVVPLLYLIVGSVVGLWGKEWPAEVRSAIATAVVSLIAGGAAGYYWGTATSRNRTPGAAQ